MTSLTQEFMNRRRRLYEDLGRIVRSHRLRCESCGAIAASAPTNGGSYFQTGWPKCCGYTMTLEAIPSHETPAGGSDA